MYAMNLDLTNRICVVIGGGQVAFRKILPLIESGAIVKIIAPEVCNEIRELESKVQWIQQKFSAEILTHGRLFFAATNDPSINDRASKIAREFGMLVNNATNPDDSDFSVPSIIRRKNFQLAISTNNLSPAFSRFIRQKLESEFPESISEFLEKLHLVREETRSKIPKSEDRIKFWRDLFESQGDQILKLLQQGNIDQAEEICKYALDLHGSQSSNGLD